MDWQQWKAALSHGRLRMGRQCTGSNVMAVLFYGDLAVDKRRRTPGLYEYRVVSL